MVESSHLFVGSILLWGLIATMAMTAILEGSQGLGLSRLSLPFLVGTFFTADRRWAMVGGFAVYTIGGSLFAFVYYFAFASVGIYSWLLGLAAGFIHGIVLLVCVLPLLPFVHPRMASEYHGATSIRVLEPPGFLGMNYGYQSPLTTLLGQTIYGTILGAVLQLQHGMGAT